MKNILFSLALGCSLPVSAEIPITQEQMKTLVEFIAEHTAECLNNAQNTKEEDGRQMICKNASQYFVVNKENDEIIFARSHTDADTYTGLLKYFAKNIRRKVGKKSDTQYTYQQEQNTLNLDPSTTCSFNMVKKAHHVLLNRSMYNFFFECKKHQPS